MLNENGHQVESSDAAVVARLERLREMRGPRVWAQPLDVSMSVQADMLKKLRRKLGGAGAAWAGCCPAELVERTRPMGLHGGVLTVAVPDASMRYRVDRWLRGGGLEEVQKASRAPVRRVKLEMRPG